MDRAFMIAAMSYQAAVSNPPYQEIARGWGGAAMQFDGMEFTEDQVFVARQQVEAHEYVEAGELDPYGTYGPDAVECAIQYCLKTIWCSFFAVAFHVPYNHHSYGQGVLGLYSTGESTLAQGTEQDGRNPDPHWVFFNVVFFPGVYLGDLYGMRHNIEAHEYCGTLGQFLQIHLPQWRTSYPQVAGQMYFDSLRHILRALGIRVWIEVFAGYSKSAFRGLDVYWKLRGPGTIDRAASWWIVNSTRPPYSRWNVSPDEWDQCPDFVSVGTRDQSYFDHLYPSKARMLFKIRAFVYDIKANRSYSYKDEICRLCGAEKEDTWHILNDCSKVARSTDLRILNVYKLSDESMHETLTRFESFQTQVDEIEA